MKVASYDLGVIDNTLAIFIRDKVDEFDVVADGEIDQGFSWRPASVTFYTFQEAEPARVATELHLGDYAGPAEQAERIIRLPFRVEESDRLDLMPVEAEPRDIVIPAGAYCLIFELGHGLGPHRTSREADEVDQLWARFTFSPGTCQPAVLRADPELRVPARLVVGRPD